MIHVRQEGGEGSRMGLLGKKGTFPHYSYLQAGTGRVQTLHIVAPMCWHLDMRPCAPFGCTSAYG